jgi:iron complex outermembrane recepter protein
MVAATSLSAQTCNLTLSGTVLDGETALGLPFATVHIPELGKGSTADQHGHYQIHGLCDQHVYEVSVSHVDCMHQTARIQFSENHQVDFTLQHRHDTLAAIMIEAKVIQLQSAASSETMHGRELESRQASGLARAIEQLPGVYSLSAGQNTAKPMIQGLSGSRIAVVQQGVVLEGQQWGADHAPEVDVFSAESVEVVKGAAGVRYGSGALGGAVVLKAPVWQNEPQYWVQNGFSTNGRGIWGAMQLEFFSKHTSVQKPEQDKKGNWRARIQASAKMQGNQSAPDYYLGNTGLREQNGRILVERSRAKSKTRLFSSFFHQSFGILKSAHTGNLTDLQAAIQSATPNNNDNRFTYQIAKPRQDVTHWLMSAEHQQDIIPKWQWKNQLSWQYNIRHEFDAHRGGTNMQKNEPALSLYNYTTLAESVLEHKPIKHWSGSVGAQGSWQYNQTGSDGYVPDQQSWIGALYLQEHWRHAPVPVEYEFGLRFDTRRTHVTDTFGFTRQLDTVFQFGQISAAGGMIYTPNEYLNIRLNSALAWRPPSMIELFALGVHHGAASYERGKATLKPEQAWNNSVEVNYAKNSLVAGLSGYINRVNGFIYVSPTQQTILTIRGAYPLYVYEQKDAQIAGSDAKLGYRLYKQLGIMANFTMLRGQIRTQNDSKEWLPLMPPDRARVSLVFDGNADIWRNRATYPYSFAIGLQAISRQNRVQTNVLLAEPPSAYVLADMQASYQATMRHGRKWVIGLSADNLLNKSYRSYLNSFRYFADENGRQMNLRIKIHF